jgi:hypothetical protein
MDFWAFLCVFLWENERNRWFFALKMEKMRCFFVGF